MKQFIPAWYDSNNWWDSAVVPFYIKEKRQNLMTW